MASCHLHELHFTVKRHHLHSMSRGVFDLRHLFAGVGVDDPAGLHTHRLHELDLGLAEETRIRSRVNTGLTLLHSYSLVLMSCTHRDTWRSHICDLRNLKDLPHTLLAQSNPAPRDASVVTTALLSLHFTA